MIPKHAGPIMLIGQKEYYIGGELLYVASSIMITGIGK